MTTENDLILIHIEDQLSDAVPVAQVDKCQSTKVAGDLHPSTQGHFLSYMFDAEFAAIMSPVHGYDLSAQR